jgi:hypothetical protein
VPVVLLGDRGWLDGVVSICLPRCKRKECPNAPRFLTKSHLLAALGLLLSSHRRRLSMRAV